MEFKVSKFDIEKALKSINTAVVLSPLVINANEKLILSSDDGTNAIAIEVEAEIKESGICVVPLKSILSLVSKSVNESISCKMGAENKVKIKCGRSTASITCEDVNPTAPDVQSWKQGKTEGTSLLQMQSDDVKTLFSKTAFAASKDNNRPTLSCVCLCAGAELLEAVAVDGYRLAIRRLEGCDLKDAAQMKAMIPLQSVKNILRLMPKKSVLVEVEVTPHAMVMQIEGIVYRTGLIAGEFLNYKKLLQPRSGITAAVKRLPLLSTLERAALFTDTGKPVVAEIAEKGVTLTSEDASGDIREELESATEGGTLRIGFSPAFLQDALKNCDDDEITLEFSTPISPIIIQGNSYTHLVLPIQMRN